MLNLAEYLLRGAGAVGGEWVVEEAFRCPSINECFQYRKVLDTFFPVHDWEVDRWKECNELLIQREKELGIN